MVKFIEFDGTIFHLDDITRIDKNVTGNAQIFISATNGAKYWRDLTISYEEAIEALGPLLFNSEEYNQFITIKK